MIYRAIVLAMLILLLLPNPSKAGESEVPSVEEVQRRAIAHARLEPKEISSWKKRAMYQAFLPKLQLDYERRIRDLIDIDISDSVYVGNNGVVVGPDEGNFSYDNQADQNISVKAVWSFNETIFNPDMLNVSAEARRLAGERNMILSEVTRNYFDRERTIGEISFIREDLIRQPGSEKLERMLRMKMITRDEKSAAIDALTGGWFSEEMRRIGKSHHGGKYD